MVSGYHYGHGQPHIGDMLGTSATSLNRSIRAPEETRGSTMLKSFGKTLVQEMEMDVPGS